MPAYLRSADGNVILITEDKVLVAGCHETCDLVLQALPVSAQDRHARLEFHAQDQSYVLTDLDTPSGTLVNGCPVKNATVQLAPGDRLQFGIGGPEYEFAFGEAPKAFKRPTSASKSPSLPPIRTIRTSSPFPASVSGSSRPSSGRKLTSSFLGTGRKPGSALRRAQSHGTLGLSRDEEPGDLPYLQKSRSGGESSFLDFSTALGGRSSVTPPPRSQRPYDAPAFVFPDDSIDIVEWEESTRMAPPRNDNFRRQPGEKDGEEDLRHISDQMHDLKAMGVDTSFAKMQTFLELREKEARMVRDELSRLHRDKRALSELLSQLSRDLVNRDAALKVQERRLREKESVLKTYVRGLQSKEEFIMEQVKTIQQKDEALREQTRTLNVESESIRNLERDVAERNEALRDRAIELNDRERIIQEQADALSQRDEALAEQKKILDTKDKKLKNTVLELRNKDDVIKAQTQCLLDKEERLTDHAKQLEEKTKLSEQLDECLRQRDGMIDKMTDDLQKYRRVLDHTLTRLRDMFVVYMDSLRIRGEPVDEGEFPAVDLDSLEALLPHMENSLKHEMSYWNSLKTEAKRLEALLREEREAKAQLESELSRALNGLENLRRTTDETIRSLEEVNTKLKESLEVLQVKKEEVDEQLAEASEKCQQLERVEEELKKKVAEGENEMESFRRQAVQATYSLPGTLPPSGPLAAKTIIAAIEQLASDRNEFSRKVAELKNALRQKKLTAHEESIARKALQETLQALEDEVKTRGRWKNSVSSALERLEELPILPTFHWVKDIVVNVYREEVEWQIKTEVTLEECEIKMVDGEADCGSAIRKLYDSLRDDIRRREVQFQQLENDFQQFREQAAREKQELRETLCKESDEKLESAQQLHDEKLKEVEESLRQKAELEKTEEIRLAVEKAESEASSQREELMVEKNKEIDQVQQTLEKTLLTLQEKEEEFKDVMAKLEMAQQEIQGKSRIPTPEVNQEDNVSERHYDAGSSEVVYSENASLENQVIQLKQMLETKEQVIENLQEQRKELQEKSEQLMAERVQRPSSVPVSRKGRYAMNLERLVQNLSIENASYKLQLEQRDTTVLQLRRQMGSLKQRHLPVNVAELQQRELDDLMDQLREKESHIHALRHDTDRLITELNKRESLINQLQLQLRRNNRQPQRSSRFRSRDADELYLVSSPGPRRHLTTRRSDGVEPIRVPHHHQLIRCRHCRHDRTRLLASPFSLAKISAEKDSSSKDLVPLPVIFSTTSGFPEVMVGNLSGIESVTPDRRPV